MSPAFIQINAVNFCSNAYVHMSSTGGITAESDRLQVWSNPSCSSHTGEVWIPAIT